MRFQIFSIFPELFEDFSKVGLIGRAVQSGLLELEVQHLRDFAINTHGQIDDTPYGGGSGMVLRPEPAAEAIERAKDRDPNAKVVLFTPRGRLLDRALVKELVDVSERDQGGLILVCCRYEGIDERIAQHWVDYEISLGDFVMMGGEVAAMSLIEATSRLLPGVLGNPESVAEESFESGLLEYPQYTKPQVFKGYEVPEVLLSGHHAEIAKWRHERAILDTRERRPDLLAEFEKTHPQMISRQEEPGTDQEGALLSCELSVALIHYPVRNKEGKTITSSVTNLDLHDIARSAKTFGIEHYYVVHPTKALRRLMGRICEHWEEGYGLQYNPNRGEALETISLVPDFDDVLIDIQSRTGFLPRIITTSAKAMESGITFAELKSILASAEEPHLLLLGTGWGLGEEILERADYHLEPIRGYTEYNHLSVRGAAAIIFDRLLGVR